MRCDSRAFATLFVVVLSLLSATSLSAEDAYFHIRLADAKFAEGTPPTASTTPRNSAILRRTMPLPYASVIGGGEAYIGPASATPRSDVANWRDQFLVARAPAGNDLIVHLALPRPNASGMELLKLVLPAKSADAKHAQSFNDQQAAHYRQLAERSMPGSAWFRHQAAKSDRALGTTADRPQRQVEEDFARQFSLFSGGRAVSENLQLDRQIIASKPFDPSVDVSSLAGISVAEIDWKPLIKDLRPLLDPLAASIPADQHVVLFPSFAAVAKLVDEARSREASLLRSGSTRSEDAKSIDWYERQLGVSLDGIARVVGPKLVDSVVLTGSDPYFPTGTDVAVLLASTQPAVLKNLLLAQMQASAAKNPDAKQQSGEVEGVSYNGFRSMDRSISSYVATLPGAVILTNSLAQLGQLAKVSHGKSPAIATLDEFKFFRARYPLGDKEETALVFLSDATIRRWCGPRWRIGNARRIYTAAVLAELQAANFDALALGKVALGSLQSDMPLVNAGELLLTKNGVVSTTQGTLHWQTPIIELDMQKVTVDEAANYGRWRDRYQSNWRWAFDPIAIRLGVQEEKFSVDLSVMPLIAGTEYRQLIDLSQGASLAADSGDRHDALAHFTLAVNQESSLFRQGRNMATMFSPDPFGWLGASVALYIDDDPLWEEIQKLSLDELSAQHRQLIWRLPIAFHAEVSNGFKLMAFLVSIRGVVEQAAPGMVTWENHTHRDLPYVKITPTENARLMLGDAREISLYYAPSPSTLVVSLNEAVIKRSLDRRADRLAQAETSGEKSGTKATPAVSENTPPWLGENVGVQVNRKAIEAVSRLSAAEYQARMQDSSWSNLPILNEWKQRYPDQNPLELHERFWHAKLYCPGGGNYVWNDEWQTMESTAYGHPGRPKVGPQATDALTVQLANFGLTFEKQGLRARVELTRAKKN